MIKTFKTTDKNVPNFSTWVTVNGKKHEIRCTDGIINVDNEDVAKYLDANNPFEQFEGYDVRKDNFENLKLENQNLKRQIKNLQEEIEKLNTESLPIDKAKTKEEKKELEKSEKAAAKAAKKK